MRREYAKAVAEIINRESDVYEADIIDVVKVNDESNVGVHLKDRRSNSGIASVHYIGDMFENGLTAEECAARITRDVPSGEDVELVNKTDRDGLVWEDVKDCITMRLVNIEYNKGYLADKIYKDLGNGLAIMFDVSGDDYKVAITHGVAKMLGCDEVMLTCAAQESKAGEPIFCDLTEKILTNNPTNYLENEDEITSNMMVLTTRDGVYGASAIYRVGTGEKIKDRIGEYYLLPASLHEWIVIPETEGILVEDLCVIVEGANHTVVDRKDLLSYGVYKWTPTGLEKVA